MGGYHEAREEFSVPWEKNLLLFEYPHGTHDIPHMYHDIHHMYHDIPHSTQITKDGIPHGTEHLHVHHDIPHGTQDNPMVLSVTQFF